MFGDSVILEPGHRIWWSYIRHFVATPFYVYAYTFGEMLALALYHRYQSQGDTFPSHYVAMLAAGGSKAPNELVAPLGVDLTDAAFWRGGLAVLEDQVAEFERLGAA
jgi:oligoendopeptidase F